LLYLGKLRPDQSCHRSKALTIRKQDTNRITACEEQQHVSNGITKYNEDIRDKLRIKLVIDYMHNYQRKWKERVNRINTRRNPKNNTLSAKRTKINRHSINWWEGSISPQQATWPNTWQDEEC